MNILAIDSETTGVDFHHGACPYYVSFCQVGGQPGFWRWRVNTDTRAVETVPSELAEIVEMIRGADEIVGQNLKFDIHALSTLIPEFADSWPWEKTNDTLLVAHLLASNRPKDLTSLATQYLGADIQPFEDAMEEACKKARNMVRHDARLKGWAIASEGRPDMPSAGKETWKYDTWLPRQVAEHLHALGDESFAPPVPGVKVISGGQTGVDLAALEAANQVGLKTGGTAPKGYRTSAGPNQSLKTRYGLAEHPSPDYPPRTLRNVEDADATVQIFENPSSPGEVLTTRLVKKAGKPLLLIDLRKGGDWVTRLTQWIKTGGYQTVNFAGNSEPTCSGIGSRVFEKLSLALAPLQPTPGHPWYGVTESYANADAAVTAALWPVMSKILRERGLWDIYQARRKLLPAVFRMERRGVTLNRTRLEDMEREYLKRYDAAGETCLKVAATYSVTNPETGIAEPFKLELAKGSAVNNSMRVLCFDLMGLEKVYNAKALTYTPTLDSKNAVPHYLNTLRPQSKEYRFIKSLAKRRERGTTLNYLAAYRRFWVPMWDGISVDDGEGDYSDTYVLHPNFRPTGTDTLRLGCDSPNAQNIAKKGITDECKTCDGVSGNTSCPLCGGKGYTTENVRKCFGPAPGREWWSLDAKNIELRIPFYEAGEKDLIALFEKPDEPPYFGSNHILNFSVIWPEIWADAVKKVGIEKAGSYCKKTYADTNYQWTKNGGFAVQYGAVDKADGTGTADRAFHRPGAHAMLKSRFQKLEVLNRKLITLANKFGYVETIPDKSVDPKRGYPLLCTRTEYGKILETVPLSYHVQGTACWCLNQMMILCLARLDDWRAADGFDGYMVMNVHDELVFDFPLIANRGNTDQVLELKQLMETVGENLVPRVPVTMGVEYHIRDWGTGETIA